MAKDDPGKNADFIGRVIGDAKNPTEARLLSGWFGDSGEEGYRRLYTDAELSNYVDIPTDAILHTEPIRDVQPAGAVFVWVRRDAELKQGGTAASRAARFLQGQVARDFSTPEKAGYRCVTQVPCGEPTGFTGQCTNQPDVGGGWPCITAIPLCSAEPTGFTGQCTDQPWPNPTKYFGCTVYHCPTRDLTHIPYICNIVASGIPGCGGFEPKKEGEGQPAAESAGGEGGGANIAVTEPPGCGYTKIWGLCETHLLGCGYTKQWGPHCPPNIAAQAPAAGSTQYGPQCPTPATMCFVCTNVPELCAGPAAVQTAPLTSCTTGGSVCLSQATCPHACGGAEAFAGGGARAAGPYTQYGPQCPTPATMCFICPPITQDIRCVGAARAAGGVGPQLTDVLCPTVTIFTPQCVVNDFTTQFNCFFTQACPPPTPFCPPPPTPGCPTPACPPTPGPRCPSAVVACTVFEPQCAGGGQVFDVGRFAAAAQRPIGPTGWQGCTWAGPGCPPTPATVCTQFGHQCLSAVDACPTRFGCGGGGGGLEAAAGAVGIGATQSGPQCPTPGTMCFICPPLTQDWRCPVEAAAAPGGGAAMGRAVNPSWVDACPTRFGCPSQQCGPTPATVCTQFGQQCQSAVDACPTRFGCGGAGGGLEAAAGAVGIGATQSGPRCPTPGTMCFICPPLTQDWRCPVEAAGGGAAQAALGVWPTPATRCFVCDPVGGGFAQQRAVAPQPIRTVFIDCIIHPTPATRCFWCPPPGQTHFQGFQCPVVF